jgi:hypothetical protein
MPIFRSDRTTYMTAIDSLWLAIKKISLKLFGQINWNMVGSSTYCNLSAKVNFRLTIFYRWKNSVRKLLQTLLENTFCVIMYDTSCKPVLIEHDFVDRWSDAHLIKSYVYMYSLQQSHFKLEAHGAKHVWLTCLFILGEDPVKMPIFRSDRTTYMTAIDSLWLAIKKISLKLFGQINWNMVGSTYGRVF